MAEDRRRAEFTQRSRVFPSSVISEAIEVGLLIPLDERWDDGAALYGSFGNIKERGLVEDLEFEIPPPQFSMEPDLEFIGQSGLRRR